MISFYPISYFLMHQSFTFHAIYNMDLVYNFYYEELANLEQQGLIELPKVPNHFEHNAHMFYIKLANLEQRTRFIEYMNEKRIMTVFHYVPLHSSPAGLKFGRFHGETRYTTAESERLVRLPMYFPHLMAKMKPYF